MEKRKVILAAAVSGLIAAGSMMAKATIAHADDAPAKADKKDSCKGKNGCGGDKKDKDSCNSKNKCSADKCKADHCKGAKKAKKKHTEEKTEEKKAQ